jgi:thiamine transporter
MNTKLQTLIEGAIIAAVAMALSYVPLEFGYGGAFDISLGLIPLFIYAARRGAVPALTVGLVWGLLHVLLGKMIFLSPSQWVLDYILAFTFAGLFGLFGGKLRRVISDKKIGPVVGWVCAAAFVGVIARWFWAFLAGALVWSEYMPETFFGLTMTPWFYSLLFNGASVVANFVMLAVIIPILAKTAPVLFRLQQH